MRKLFLNFLHVLLNDFRNLLMQDGYSVDVVDAGGTLLGALRKTGGKRGVASLCIGGGEATALAVEML